MCGRFTLATPIASLVDMFGSLAFPNGIRPRFNIAPTQPVLCVREYDGQRQAASLRWGLVPFWAKDLKIGAKMINARSETVATKPSFRTPFKRRRCLVIADGFYEWKKTDSGKQPFYIQVDQRPFCMAGLWESWRDKSLNDPMEIETCTVLTTAANEMMEPLHDRMPVILAPDQYPLWLDSHFSEVETLEGMLQSYPGDSMTAFPVSRDVNKPINDSADCIQPIPEG